MGARTQTNRSRPSCDRIGSTLQSLNVLISLIPNSNSNAQRFENFKNEIMALELPRRVKAKAKTFVESAAQYLEYGETGAVKFELNCLARLIRSQLIQSSRSI